MLGSPPIGLPAGEIDDANSHSGAVNGFSTVPTLNTLAAPHEGADAEKAVRLELKDGSAHLGISFGANKSVSGELVFQTGMVGYPESITDPSYRGQILVVTFPLIGNYGVPSRDIMDEILGDLPAHFEATQIHISGLIVASYSGEDYSHHLATSSLGTWLKEQDIPAMYGVDTRALTKRIREEGSMLGKMVMEASNQSNGIVHGHIGRKEYATAPSFEDVEWDDPNTKNLVAEGDILNTIEYSLVSLLISFVSLYPRASCLHSTSQERFISYVWSTSKNRLHRCGTQIQSAPLPSLKRSGGLRRPLGLQLSRSFWQRLRWSLRIEWSWGSFNAYEDCAAYLYCNARS